MTSRGVILGDWTHRRADAGGTRAVSADVGRSRPEIAWSWRPDHGGRVDQVRISGSFVYVATMAPPDPAAPGWEHATVYALDAQTGRVIAERELPDPVPVAAMVADAGTVHVIATRKGEAIYWYALTTAELVPRHRGVVELDRDARREDVLDAWASPDGGVWLEIEGALGGTGGRAYAFVAEGASVAVTQTHEEDVAAADWGSPARDACCGGHELFAPLAGGWRDDATGTAPALWRIETKVAQPHEIAQGKQLIAPATAAWARTDVVGPRARVHAMLGDGVVCAVAAAADPERTDRGIVQALAIDRSSGVVRWKSEVLRVQLRAPLAEAARVARRSNGELLMQALQGDGDPASDLICARSDGSVDTLPIGNGKGYVLDAALGELVLAHHESKNGRVTVAAIEIDREGRLLGRRSVARWSVDTEDLGGSTTVYAGAGHVVVRGARSIAALRV